MLKYSLLYFTLFSLAQDQGPIHPPNPVLRVSLPGVVERGVG